MEGILGTGGAGSSSAERVLDKGEGDGEGDTEDVLDRLEEEARSFPLLALDDEDRGSARCDADLDFTSGCSFSARDEEGTQVSTMLRRWFE